MKYLQLYEEHNNQELHFSVNVEELLKNGYTFQKLYAHNYITYFKEVVPQMSIRCWFNDKLIEIKDYYENSKKVAEYYMGLPNDLFTVSKTFDDYVYSSAYLNTKTNEIISRKTVIKKYLGDLGDPTTFLESEYEQSEDWQKIVFVKKTWDKIIEELVFLTNGEIKDNSNYKTWELNKNSEKYNI